MKLSKDNIRLIIKKEELSQLERDAKELGYDAWADNLTEKDLQKLIDMIIAAYNTLDNPKKTCVKTDKRPI